MWNLPFGGPLLPLLCHKNNSSGGYPTRPVSKTNPRVRGLTRIQAPKETRLTREPTLKIDSSYSETQTGFADSDAVEANLCSKAAISLACRPPISSRRLCKELDWTRCWWNLWISSSTRSCSSGLWPVCHTEILQLGQLGPHLFLPETRSLTP